MSMSRLSIIVVNWNTVELLERCLGCIYREPRPQSIETIVVDNASSDGSVRMVKEKYPTIRLIVNSENVGFARANNQGIQASSGEYILLLNSDAFLMAGTLEKMIEKMESFPDTGAMGCKLLYEDHSLQRSCQSFPGLRTELWQAFLLDKVFSASRVFGMYQMTYWDMNDFREVDVVMGAVLLLRRSALDQIGLLDESFFMYSEEVDLCYRLKLKGWKVRFLPDAQAIHLWGGSSRKVPAATFVRLYRSRVHFFRKHYGQVRTFLFKGILFTESLMRIAGGYLGYALLRRDGLLRIARGYRHVIGQVWAF